MIRHRSDRIWIGRSLLMSCLCLNLTAGSVCAQVLIESDTEPEDIPEEVLEAEIILEARSPLNGEPLTPAEYAQLQDELRLARGEVPGRLDPKIHRSVFLLRLRKLISTFLPFLF